MIYKYIAGVKKRLIKTDISTNIKFLKQKKIVNSLLYVILTIYFIRLETHYTIIYYCLRI